MQVFGPTTANDAPEGRCSILSATTLETPEFRWVGLKKLTWQVGPVCLSSLWILAPFCSNQQSLGASYTILLLVSIAESTYSMIPVVSIICHMI